MTVQAKVFETGPCIHKEDVIRAVNAVWCQANRDKSVSNSHYTYNTDIHAWGNLSRLPFQHSSNALLLLKKSMFSREQIMSTCFTSPKVVCVEIRASHSLIVWQKPLCHPNVLLIRALGLSGRGWNKKQSSPQPIGSINTRHIYGKGNRRGLHNLLNWVKNNWQTDTSKSVSITKTVVKTTGDKGHLILIPF